MSKTRKKVKSEIVDTVKTEDLSLVQVPSNEDDHGILGGKRQAAPLILEKALKILKILDSLYPDPPVPLNHVNDFTFLVAVVLSAQTTDGKVNEVTKELFALADTPQKMMQLSVEEVLRIIRPLGLSAKKAVFVVELSKKLVEDFGGVVPSSFEALESLPGVGHKTASVIRSQCFGIAAFAVDTHVHRLALRWGLSKEQKNVEKVQADLCAAFPEYSWHKAHLQMIYFGREYCTAKSHEPRDCPICSWVNSHGPAAKNPPVDLSTFSPQKRAKGLVYYHDRHDELRAQPHLAVYSSPSPDKKRREGLVWDKKEAAGAVKLEFAEAKEEEEEVILKVVGNTAEVKSRKRKVSMTPVVATDENAEETNVAEEITLPQRRTRRKV